MESNNSFSTYYDGYIYYKKGAYLCRQKTEEYDGVETIYYLKDEDAAFIINGWEIIYKLSRQDR